MKRGEVWWVNFGRSVGGEGKAGKAMTDQLATVTKERLIRKAGTLTAEEMEKVAEAIRVQLDIS